MGQYEWRIRLIRAPQSASNWDRGTIGPIRWELPRSALFPEQRGPRPSPRNPDPRGMCEESRASSRERHTEGNGRGRCAILAGYGRAAFNHNPNMSASLLRVTYSAGNIVKGGNAIDAADSCQAVKPTSDRKSRGRFTTRPPPAPTTGRISANRAEPFAGSIIPRGILVRNKPGSRMSKQDLQNGRIWDPVRFAKWKPLGSAIRKSKTGTLAGQSEWRHEP